MAEKKTRPRQANLAVGLIMAGSLVAVLLAFERVSGLTSLETREAFERTLDEPGASGLGLSVDALIGLTRAMSFIVAAGATATGILGFYALQRSRGARIALSFIAPVLFLAGVLVAGFVSSFVAVGVILLWLRPTRDWYAGRPWTEQRPGLPRPAQGQSVDGPAPQPQPPTASAAAPVASPPPAYPGSSPTGSGQSPTPGQQARPTQGFGSLAAAAPPAHGPVGHPGQPLQTEVVRPRAVLWACVITWVMSGLTLVLVAISLVAVFASPEALLEEALREQPDLRGQGVTVGLVQGAFATFAVVVGLWCVIAVVAAVLAFRRVGWAQVTLAISAGVAGALALVVSIVTLGGAGAGPVVVLTTVLTISLLLRPESRAWYSRGGS